MFYVCWIPLQVIHEAIDFTVEIQTLTTYQSHNIPLVTSVAPQELIPRVDAKQIAESFGHLTVNTLLKVSLEMRSFRCSIAFHSLQNLYCTVC